MHLNVIISHWMHVRSFHSNGVDLPKIKVIIERTTGTVGKALLSSYIVTHDGIDCGF